MIELDVIDAGEARREERREERETASGQRFWRSRADLTDHPAHRKIAQNEFMDEAIGSTNGAADGQSDGRAKAPSGPSRREFLKLMGASVALAGLTACRQPVEKIVPYVRPPEEVIPGIPLFYATAMPFRGVARGLLVESHTGRPTKVEGNPQHPATQGTTSGFEQASVLSLYDPWRSETVRREDSEASWQDFVDFARRLAAQPAGTRVAVLAERTSSPTVEALREQMQQRYPALQWITYAPEGDDPEQQGFQQAFGRPLRPSYRFDRAEVIVSLDADFLGPTERNFVLNTRRFSRSRRLDGPSDETEFSAAGGQMSRFYTVESRYSLTGSQGDHRLPMKASRIPALAQALAAELGLGASAGEALTDRERRFVQATAEDLQAAGANGLLLAGDTQPPAVHALCAAVNSRLGSIGTTLELLDTDADPEPPQADELAALVTDMRAGQVDVLLMLGANPVYDLPESTGFAEAMQRVPETIHLGPHINETAQLSRWHLPRAHYLEQWGDGRAYGGTLSVIQPLIAPLYDDAHSEIEVLGLLATGLDQPGYDIVRTRWREIIGGAEADYEDQWRQLLHDGFLPDTQYPTVQASASMPDAGQFPPGADEEGLEITFHLDPCLLTGEYANNAWMQELPAPTTKIVWDNVALMSRRTARALDVDVEYEQGRHYADVIELTAPEGGSVELPVWIQPGYPDGTVGVSFGYGREIVSDRVPADETIFQRLADAYESVYERGEPLANGVGVRVAPLRSAELARVVQGAEVRKTGETQMVVTTQEHGSMEGRALVRWGTLEEYRENPDFADDAVHMIPGVPEESWEEYPMLWQEQHPSDEPAFADSDYYENQWGMVIDLNRCTGCNACIVACQSENNVQVVGKEQVARGREMHWLRLDRYYVSGPDAAPGEEFSEEDAFDNPQMVMQPVMCQHCENAPCESVCPVAATLHSPDGMNQMIYNRCIGTRYCSNNCPYKVRRFNFYNWSKTIPTTVQMAQNPDVTVRFRGVMEKCSWCVQRIRGAQQRADQEDRSLREGEVQTACQQACPAEAIVFGDLNNPSSEVVELKKHARDYELLAQLNVKPRLSYLSRVTNPNAELVEN